MGNLLSQLEVTGGFHGADAVAELKRDLPLRVEQEERRQRFHGADAVAELKREEGGRTRPLAVTFPRRRRRGRIEATTPGPRRAGRQWFPRRRRRGRIEAPPSSTRNSTAAGGVSTAPTPWPN